MAMSLPDELGNGHLLRADQGESVPDARLRKPDIALNPARLRAFLRDIEKPAGLHGCWTWRGSLNRDGYASGRMGVPVHRLAYVWMVGPIPDGYELDHLCRNRACVNPHHLEPVTVSENRRRSRQPDREWEIRRYCRRGHVLDTHNARVWSNGKGKLEFRCYLCHDGKRKPRNGDAA